VVESIEAIENKIDDIIDITLKMYNTKKRTLWVISILLFFIFLIQISQYVDYFIYQPIRDALEEGVTPIALSHAVALGLCSGVCAPGVRLLSMLLMAEGLHLLRVRVSVSMLAISAAINTALTIPNLFIWKVVYFNIGSKLFKGGKYIRPFVAGIVPWALSVPLIYLLTYYGVHLILTHVLRG
jgi:hypothetical protein